MRKFEIVKDEELHKYHYLNKENVILPKRQTIKSAGYDFYLPYDISICAGKNCIVKTGIKVMLEDDEVFEIYIRSSMAIKNSLVILNQVGIIDADYYNNNENDGHIMIALYNNSSSDIYLKKGDRIAQGIFKKYLITYDDDVKISRVGGIGSTK